MFLNRARLAWRLLVQWSAPAYVAIDYYMEAMRAPDRDRAADDILSAAARPLWERMPRNSMQVCRALAGRFTNLVLDGSTLLAEEPLWKLKVVIHTILTSDDYRALHGAARGWNEWLPLADTFARQAKALDRWRILPAMPKPPAPPAPPKRGRGKLRAGDATPSLFDMVA